MVSEKNLYARAILLEAFNDGAPVDRALKRVIGEVGDDSMSEKESVELYQQFRRGNKRIVSITSPANNALIQSGLFLKSNRSMVYRNLFNEAMWFCETHGIDQRFQIAHGLRTSKNFILETVSGFMKEIKLPWKKLCLENMYSISDDEVVGTMTAVQGFFKTTTLFTGSIDLVEFQLIFKHAYNVGRAYKHYLFVNEQISVLQCISNGMSLSVYEISNGQLSLCNERLLDFELSFPALRGDKLYGFACNSPVVTTTLIEFSLANGTKKEYQIEKKNQLNVSIYPPFGHSCINDKLFIARHYGSNLETIVEFDFAALKWNKTNIKVQGFIQKVSVVENTLFVYSSKYTKRSKYQHSIHQFRLNKVDTMVDLIRGSVVRYSMFNPQFSGCL